MTFWMNLWKALLVVSLTFFGFMSILVTFGGAIDIQRMLRRVEESHKKAGE